MKNLKAEWMVLFSDLRWKIKEEFKTTLDEADELIEEWRKTLFIGDSEPEYVSDIEYEKITASIY